MTIFTAKWRTIVNGFTAPSVAEIAADMGHAQPYD